MQIAHSTKLQMHYYLENGSHSMDAIARNKCESEVLAIVQEIAKVLNTQIVIEAEAWKEGGLRDIWAFTNANAAVISVIVSIAGIVISRIPTTDPELEQLQKEDLKLSILERRINLAKLQKEVEEDKVTQDTVEKVASLVDTNYKVVTRKSNFYKQLNNTPKITKVGINGLDKEGEEAFKEAMVQRSDFKRFILHSNSLPVQIEDNAVIEIISPVLRNGRHKWKGIYKGESISFSMNDQDFKRDVLSEQISFTHGAAIKCVLHIHRKLDEVGDVVVTGYSVDTVIENGQESVFQETMQGKKYRHQKALKDAQQDLFASN
ncbi:MULTISPECIES: hypothetical protein [Vibrionaceae]|uniref:hypothetical protein n=1 Tax=Vibrionaceae TaxID=641 RepID=UPI00038E2871|nr:MULTISPECIES: hypothetical protein [Vibrionaceae]EWS66908.1 hypothetical protein Y702_24050 [Vibrio vulnificus BAA87]HDM8135451.1 hypothetical protein [Vibrio harveyi]ANQ55816.1 hypothetical protein AB831_06390 [Vibrio parahaemolyticus]ASO15678.1 hypothetical protein BGM07_015515 [Vibrio parahaemolyticus]AWA89805.1 hypothetical protein BSG32_12515 [Vibrio parahaemolyticus]